MKKIYFCLFIACSLLSQAQMTVIPGSVATALAQTITGFGVTVSNASLSCTSAGAGTFTYTGTHLGLTSGVILTTGNATTAAQPQSSFSGTDNGNNISDPQLTAIEPLATHNLCKLEFDFVPICPSLSIKYVFASEEYPSFVGAGYNDAFGIFLTGANPSGGNYTNQNIAKLPNGQAVSINNVNSSSNSSSFVANYNLNYNDIVYGGYTVPITSTASITPCQTYHIKFAIADAGDGSYDSGVFIQNAGLSCTTSPTITPSSIASGCGSTGTASVTVTGVAPSSYSWQPGGQTTPGITGQPPGTYTCIMTFSSACSSYTQSQSVTIGATAAAVSATASNSGSLTCVTASAQVVATTTSTPVTYAWTGPGSVAGASTSTGTVSVGGSYTCVITNTSTACSTTVTTVVMTNTVHPVPSVTAPATITCVAPTVTLSGSPGSGVSYTWTGTGITSGSNTASPTVNQAGTYSLMVTDLANGCTGSTTVSVITSAATPSVTLTPATLTITCTSPTVGVTATSTTTPLSYSWTPAPFSGVTTNTAVFNAPGVYTVTATNSSNGCSTTATVSVSSNTTAPSVTITPSQTLTCSSPTAVINTTVSPSTGIGYTWSGPGVTGAFTPSVTASQGGTYSVTVTNAANGCTNTAFSNITSASGLPSASIVTTPLNSILTCVNHTVNLNAVITPTTSITYTWSTGGSTSSTSVTNAGVVTLTVTNTASGCTTTAQYSVTSNTTPPSLSVSNATVPCGVNSSTVLTASSTNTNVSYSWTATGGGSITSGSNTASPTVAGAGNYNVTVTNPANGCTTSSVATVSQLGVSASFSASPTSGVAPLAVTFTNQSTGASSYAWDFGNGSGSTSVNPSTGYPTAGTYTVELIAFAGTCADTAYAVIVVNPPFNIEIPNVFTPNGDHINDIFMFKSNGVKDLSLVVFNRWGEKMCDVSGVNAGWDGNAAGGGKAPDGTYFFFIKATGFDGTEVNKQGTVNLYR